MFASGAAQRIVTNSSEQCFVDKSAVALIHPEAVWLLIVRDQNIRPLVAIKIAQTTPRPGPGLGRSRI